MPGTLYLVATPIGNLKDITLRAIDVLRDVDVIACEDTRHTRKLLTSLDIGKKLISYHEHNEAERAAEIVEFLSSGKNIAIVSDAGTPGINDPGYRVVRAAADSGFNVVPVPGPAAFVNATVVSGLPTDSLFFGGFLPSKKQARQKRLKEIRNIPATLVFYETPHRLLRSLEDCIEILGDRNASVSRELTKLHEETVRGKLVDIRSHFETNAPRGEFVICIGQGEEAGEMPQNKTLAERVAEIEAETGDRKAALKQAAKEFGMSKSEAYRTLQSAKS
jgi:16S rRNA (cytidine1402-2'-O)-methyltransferase